MNRTPTRAFRSFERLILGTSMSMMALVIERRLIRALKRGGLDRAPRTAEESEAYLEEVGAGATREAGLSPSAKEIGDQADR
jgi:hypothetical protein